MNITMYDIELINITRANERHSPVAKYEITVWIYFFPCFVQVPEGTFTS